MILLVLLALQQAPTLEEKASAEVQAGKCLALKVSRTGKYLIRGEPEKLNVHDAESLKLLKSLETPWTGFAFDEKDSALTVIGKDRVRFRAGGWNELGREPLLDPDYVDSRAVPKKKFVLEKDLAESIPRYLLPGQAWITADEDIYYRSKQGAINLALTRDGQRVFEKFESKMVDGDTRIRAILDVVGPRMLLGLDDGGVAVHLFQRQKAYQLAVCRDALVAGEVANWVVVVGLEMEGLYHSGTYKCHFVRGEQANTGAALDPQKSWIFVSDQQGLRAWSPVNRETVTRYKEITKPCLSVAIDVAARTLYTVEDDRIRRWALKD